MILIYNTITMDNNTLEQILKEKILNLSNFLKSKSDNETQNKLIDKKLNDLKFYEILLFISFLQKNQIDTYIEQFLNTYKIEDSDETRNTIKEYMSYFVEVKEIMNQK